MTAIDETVSIKQVKCGYDGTMFITDSGALLACGRYIYLILQKETTYVLFYPESFQQLMPFFFFFFLIIQQCKQQAWAEQSAGIFDADEKLAE